MCGSNVWRITGQIPGANSSWQIQLVYIGSMLENALLEIERISALVVNRTLFVWSVVKKNSIKKAEQTLTAMETVATSKIKQQFLNIWNV